MKGIGYFQNLSNVLEMFWIFWEFFRKIFLEKCFGGIFSGEMFWEDFLGRIFLGGFFRRIILGGILWEELFSRN